LREAVVYLTGLSQRGIYGQSYRVKEDITIEDLRERANEVIRREIDVIRDQLARNHVALLDGAARFIDPTTVVVERDDGGERKVGADSHGIATGAKPARPDAVEFDDRTIFDSDGLVNAERIPGALV